MDSTITLVVTLPTRRGDVLPTNPIVCTIPGHVELPQRVENFTYGTPLYLDPEEIAVLLPYFREAMEEQGYRTLPSTASDIWIVSRRG